MSTELFLQELRMCGVHDGETVVVLSQGDETAARAAAFVTAASRLGANACHLNLPEAAPPVGLSDQAAASTVGVMSMDDNPAVIDALKAADMVVDLMFLLFAKEKDAILASGTRMLSCMEPVDVLQRLFPTRERRERVEAGARILGGAEALRITSPAGTDVTYRLGAYPAYGNYGYTDTPGRWDHWPSGLVYTGAAEDAVDGKLVIAPGDQLFPFKKYVERPIELRIEAGHVVDVAGEHDAQLLKDYMDSFHDPRGYAISHIGWGMHESALWSGLAVDQRGMGMESRVFNGNVLFSTGPNQELGGTNDTACHIDVPMRGCSVFVDDRPVLVDGQFVIDELRAHTPANA